MTTESEGFISMIQYRPSPMVSSGAINLGVILEVLSSEGNSWDILCLSRNDLSGDQLASFDPFARELLKDVRGLIVHMVSDALPHSHAVLNEGSLPGYVLRRLSSSMPTSIFVSQPDQIAIGARDGSASRGRLQSEIAHFDIFTSLIRSPGDEFRWVSRNLDGFWDAALSARSRDNPAA